MTRRTRAREIALQVLYQDDLNPGSNPATADVFLKQRLKDEELVEFARSLVSGVRRNRAELDEMLEQTADNWSIERMAATDRNVLRLGAYEILFLARLTAWRLTRRSSWQSDLGADIRRNSSTGSWTDSLPDTKKGNSPRSQVPGPKPDVLGLRTWDLKLGTGNDGFV
jgi:hypothetical protein